MEKLALLGGTPVISETPNEELFKWPIITKEDEDAVMDIVRTNNFSGTDITEKFQDEFAVWQGRRHALAFTNGTMSLTAAMFAVGLGAGDEIVCTTKTYWASIVSAQWLGASVVFCGINDMLSMDVDELEKCITPKTKAIMVVHYFGYPCDMDRIMAIAEKHGLLVIEDVSHAQGGMYKGKKLGNFGHVAAMSMMSGKAFAAGEMGMLVTDDRRIYERAIAFGHYERNNPSYIKESEDLAPYYHIALGGMKGRVNQVSAALGRGQLKHYDARCAEIRRAMNYFWDLLSDLKGIRGLRVDEADGSHMGGFYCPHGIYDASAFGGLSLHRFCEALTAEMGGTFASWGGANYCLHTHGFFKTFDGFGIGKPMRVAFSDGDVPNDEARLSASVEKKCFTVPWFKKYDKTWIERYAKAFRKVVENYEQLLESDGESATDGRWHGTSNA